MNTTKPTIIIAGGNGFLGHALAAYFQKAGQTVVILTRSPGTRADGIREIVWDAKTIGPWMRELEGASAVINLVGRSVDCRYTARNRELIMASRVDSTRVIGQAIAQCKTPPPVWLNASTATIYKHTYGMAWTEAGETGATPEAKDEFSVEVATTWEKVLNEAQTPGTRKVAMCAAMVFGLGQNSVFPVLRRLTRFWLGGRMASGRQFVSWIHETDFCRAIEWLMNHEKLSGPVNISAPNPITNAEVMRTFRKICRMPVGLPAAKWMLEIGAFFLRTETELLIKSRRVVPGKLLESGFDFQFPVLRPALENLNKRMEV